MAKPLSDKSNINEGNKADSKKAELKKTDSNKLEDKKSDSKKTALKKTESNKLEEKKIDEKRPEDRSDVSKAEGSKSDAKESTSNPPPTESKAQKTKNKLINKLSLNGITSGNNNSEDKSSNKENGKNGKKPVSAQNSREEGTAESPPPTQVQKKKKLSFRQRLSRCGSGCKNKITKKNSNEMELENASSSNNDLTSAGQASGQTSGQNNRQTSTDKADVQATCSPKLVEDVDINSPNASSAKQATNNQNNQNPDANHCARTFFCWCCSCCSCLNSNLTFDQNCKENSSLNINKNEHSSADHTDFSKINEPPPTLDDIRNWGESFDKLIHCSWGRSVFREFLKREYSEENILFWLACEDLKTEDDISKIEERARQIYEEFISILSPKEVSLDSRVRDVINKNMLMPTKETFEEAQLQIYTLMQRDSYPRFINSPTYRKMAQLPSPSRKNSVVVAAT